MERADYLRALRGNPWNFPAVEGCPDPPPKWVAAAWDTRVVQDCIASDLARDVSKGGTMRCGPGYLEGLSAALSTEQVVRFFHLIRDQSPHREREFRPQFEQAFTRHAAALPPPLTRQEVIDMLGLDEKLARHLLDGEPWTED
jgi:hypothetical protein